MAFLLIWLRETGMRLREALSVWVDDILPDRSAVRLHRGVKRNKDGDQVRTIDLTDGARAVVAALGTRTGRLFGGLHSDPAVVSTRYGQWCRQRQGREDRAAAAEGREPVQLFRFRLHDLRHAFAVASLVRDPTSAYRLKWHLGHASVKTTEEYAEHIERHGLNRGATSRGSFGTMYGWLPPSGAVATATPAPEHFPARAPA